VTELDESESTFLYGAMPTKAKHMERCRLEVESCQKAGTSQGLTPVQRLGALQSELTGYEETWLKAKNGLSICRHTTGQSRFQSEG
jgi:hypothetical protein